MSSDKTELPTSKRLQQIREEGNVAKSVEIVTATTVVAVIVYFILYFSSILQIFVETIDYVFKTAITVSYERALPLIGYSILLAAFKIVFPIVSVVILFSLISLLMQTKFLFAPKAAIPKLENLNPKKWFKQVFSKKNIFEFFKNLIKVLVLTFAVFKASEENLKIIFNLQNRNISDVWTVSGLLFRDLFIYTIISFSILAILDYLYTKYKYIKDNMMSIDEVKREYKEMEGDPYIKQKRKQLHQEIMNQNTLSNTKKAKVLIVNPTHYAVAIFYEKGETELPIVLAKAKGYIAKCMIDIANENNIYIMRDIPLARSLFAKSKEGEQVPSDLLMQVASVLRYVMNLKKEVV